MFSQKWRLYISLLISLFAVFIVLDAGVMLYKYNADLVSFNVFIAHECIMAIFMYLLHPQIEVMEDRWTKAGFLPSNNKSIFNTNRFPRLAMMGMFFIQLPFGSLCLASKQNGSVVNLLLFAFLFIMSWRLFYMQLRSDLHSELGLYDLDGNKVLSNESGHYVHK